jgi:hypothetical protein
MPIVTDYSPAQTIEQMGFLAGRGDFNRWLADQQFRQAQAAQQAAQFQQQQSFRENAFIAENQQQQQQAANRNAIMQWQRQNEVADRQNQQQFQLGLAGQRQQWDMQDQAAQQQAITGRAQEMAAFTSAEQGGDAMEKEIGETLTTFAKQRQFLTPEGRNVLNNLQADFQARRKTREWGRPAVHAQAMGELASQIQRADLQQYVNEPKSVQEQVKSGGSFQEPVYDSQGQEIGTTLWTSTMRNGVPTLTPKIIPKKPIVDPREDWLNKNLKNFEDPDTGEINIDRAMHAYEKLQTWKANQMAAAEGFPPMPLPPEPQRKPTVRTAANFDEYWQALPPDKREAIEKDSATRLGTKEDELDKKTKPSQSEIMADVRSRISAIHGFGKGDSQDTEEAGQLAASLEFNRLYGQKKVPAIGEEYTAPDGTRRRRMQ